MEKVIKGLCEIGKFSAAYSLNNRRYEEGTINKHEYEMTDDFIFEYRTTEKEPMTIEENPKKTEAEDVKKAMTAAERQAKAKAKLLKNGGAITKVKLTSKAADQLSNLCFEWGMNKTEVINKLLEEQEQRQLL